MEYLLSSGNSFALDRNLPCARLARSGRGRFRTPIRSKRLVCRRLPGPAGWRCRLWQRPPRDGRSFPSRQCHDDLGFRPSTGASSSPDGRIWPIRVFSRTIFCLNHQGARSSPFPFHTILRSRFYQLPSLELFAAHLGGVQENHAPAPLRAQDSVLNANRYRQHSPSQSVGPAPIGGAGISHLFNKRGFREAFRQGYSTRTALNPGERDMDVSLGEIIGFAVVLLPIAALVLLQKTKKKRRTE